MTDQTNRASTALQSCLKLCSGHRWTFWSCSNRRDNDRGTFPSFYLWKIFPDERDDNFRNPARESKLRNWLVPFERRLGETYYLLVHDWSGEWYPSSEGHCAQPDYSPPLDEPDRRSCCIRYGTQILEMSAHDADESRVRHSRSSSVVPDRTDWTLVNVGWSEFVIDGLLEMGPVEV